MRRPLTTLGHALVLMALLGSGHAIAAPAADEPPAVKDRPRPMLAIAELAGLLGFLNFREVHEDGTLVWRGGPDHETRAQLSPAELSDLNNELDLNVTRAAVESLRWLRRYDSVGLVIERGSVSAEVPFNEVPPALWPVIEDVERLFTEHFGDDYRPLTLAGKRPVPSPASGGEHSTAGNLAAPVGRCPQWRLEELLALVAAAFPVDHTHPLALEVSATFRGCPPLLPGYSWRLRDEGSATDVFAGGGPPVQVPAHRARRLGLASARIVIYRQTVEPYPRIELSARDRAELVAVLDDVGTYYDWPGVIACVCDRRNEVVLELHLKERDLEASFCSTCQRIYSWGPEADELNLPLSKAGTKALSNFFERLLGAAAPQ